MKLHGRRSSKPTGTNFAANSRRIIAVAVRSYPIDPER
jgi:hypothetical protein